MIPTGLPQNLMDDFVPVSPALRDEEEEDAGWGEMSREDIREAKAGKGKMEEDSEEDERELIDLDAVARDEMGVWGRDED